MLDVVGNHMGNTDQVCYSNKFTIINFYFLNN